MEQWLNHTNGMSNIKSIVAFS